MPREAKLSGCMLACLVRRKPILFRPPVLSPAPFPASPHNKIDLEPPSSISIISILKMLPLPSQDWQMDAAYRKGYQRGLAATEPTRIITVVLGSFSTPPDPLGIPRWITLKVQQCTPTRDILSEIHRRLPEIAYPFTITTVGRDAHQLNLEDQSLIMDHLPNFDGDTVSLRMNIQIPQPYKAPKTSLASRLRSALGASNAQSRDSHDGDATMTSGTTDVASSRSSLRSAPPPPYEDALQSRLR